VPERTQQEIADEMIERANEHVGRMPAGPAREAACDIIAALCALVAMQAQAIDSFREIFDRLGP
jgi:hypothetical protein